MKNWKSFTKIELTKKLPVTSTFLEVYFLLVTNQSWPLSVKWIVSEFSEQPAEVIRDGDNENEDKESDEKIPHPWRNEVGVKSVQRGFRFWSFNLKANLHNQSVKKKSLRQSSINNFFKQQWIKICYVA